MKEPSFLRITSRASRSREDQLTEVVAFVFKVAPELARRFVVEVTDNKRTDQLIPPVPATQEWNVSTQFSYRGERAGRPDLVLAPETFRIWIEAKLDSGPSTDQLSKYYDGLSKECREDLHGVLVYLTRQGASAGPVDDLLLELETKANTFVAVCEYDWVKLEKAMCVAADELELVDYPQAQLASELATYLTESGAIVPPIDPKKTGVVSSFSEVKAGLWDLLDNGVMYRVYKVFGKEKKRPSNGDAWPGFPRYQASYQIEHGEEVFGYPLLLEWNFDDRTDWAGRSGPAVAWGLTLDWGGGEWSEDMRGLVERLGSQGFLPLEDGNHPRLYQHMFLQDLLEQEDLTEGRVRVLSSRVIDGLRIAQSEAKQWIAENR